MNDRTADRLDERTPSLHTPEHREKGAALLIIDMIGDFEHKNGEDLARHALPAASNIARLKQRAADKQIPVIYVNDNFGEWRHDFQATLDKARESKKGSEIVRLIEPTADDYHILKPQRSGFFSTPLDVLLATLKVSDLILTGASTDICILFTAHDAYMRGFNLIVPPDCTAAANTTQHRDAIALLQRLTDADTRLSEKIVFKSSDDRPGPSNA